MSEHQRGWGFLLSSRCYAFVRLGLVQDASAEVRGQSKAQRVEEETMGQCSNAESGYGCGCGDGRVLGLANEAEQRLLVACGTWNHPSEDRI